MSKATDAIATMTPFRATNYGPFFTRDREIATVIEGVAGEPGAQLYLSGERWLSPESALRLAAWIVATFADQSNVGRADDTRPTSATPKASADQRDAR